MGESNRVRTLYVAETTWGTTPATPTMLELLRTGGSFGFANEAVRSAAVKSDRNRVKSYRTGKLGANGASLDFELAYGQLDDWLLAAMATTASAAINLSITGLVFATADDSITRGSGSYISDGIVAGMWILIPSGPAGVNLGYHKVLTVAALAITVATNLADETVAGATTIKNHGMGRNASTAASFSVEFGHLDINQFFLYKGTRIGGFTFNMTAGGLVTVQATGIQSLAPVRATSTAASVITAVNSNDTYNAASEIPAFWEGAFAAAETGDDIPTAFTLSMGNNLRRRRRLSDLDTTGIPYGSFDVEGSFDVYAGGSGYGALVDKALNYTESAAAIRLTNGATDKTIILTLPLIQYKGGVPDPNGLDQDVMSSFPFDASGGANAYTVQFDRFSV